MDSQCFGRGEGSTSRQGGGYSKQVPASLVAAGQDEWEECSSDANDEREPCWGDGNWSICALTTGSCRIREKKRTATMNTREFSKRAELGRAPVAGNLTTLPLAPIWAALGRA
jgi:hypothetical protein